MADDNMAMPSTLGDSFETLKRLNSRLAHWAASLSWLRMAALFIVLGIASSIISNQFHLKHDSVQQKSKKSKRVSTSVDGKCDGKRITIGGPDGLVICVDEKGTRQDRAATPKEPAASASEGAEPAASSTTPAGTPMITITTPEEESNEDRGPRTIRTFGGFIGDLIQGLYTALLAYFVAAKIIVRKTEESEARVRSAEGTAGHEAMQRQLVQARLKLLQAQIEPHFLFNTLAAVDYLIETDTKRASVMQKTLIQYLRAALPQMRQESSTLGRELVLTRAYLDLLKMRIEERLEIRINVPAGLESAVFPPMMLQTLVENAIKHGIEPKPEGGRVSILAQVQHGELWVEVADTGVGLPSGDIFTAPTTGTGLGLENIRDRLAMLYPNLSRIDLRSDSVQGTVVRIVIPYVVVAPTQDSAAKPAGPGAAGA